jgi:hypothetical protein
MSYIGTGVSPNPLSNDQLPAIIDGKTLSNCTLSNANVTATTNASATFATSSLPLVPEGYIEIDINGTTKKIPYYGV